MLALLCLLTPSAEAALASTRSAFYASEPVPITLTGVKKGAEAQVEARPRGKGPSAVTFPLRSDVGFVSFQLPPGLLAPGEYDLLVDGKPQFSFTVSSGVNVSPMLLSQTVSDPKKAGGNFLVGNAFSFGLLDPKGQPLAVLRGRRSQGIEAFEKAVRQDMPTLVYMYWTGYVTHKPFGSEKSWAAEDMGRATRLLSLHTAQRLRRYDRNILMTGTLDEPGLSWGKTPAGGMASGFPNWDEEGWYAKRGWKYTQDPASRDNADWMKYMAIRCAIMKEVNAQAKKDLRSIWPSVTFSTDLYAPQAVMDGTDPLNQQVNDVPSSHVFLDWGCGKLGALSGLFLEKSDDPRRKIAHAMNGQLFGKPVAQPGQRNAYRLMLNAMLAAGLHSNWWLNPTGMSAEDLAWVNEPGLRLGPLFRAYAPVGHDVAVLWSFTEAAMRQKDVAAKEAKKKDGEQIKLMIASLPDLPGAKDKLVDINAYNVGGNYKEQVLTAHQALARAGWPAHILHERVLKDHLARYKALVIVGQTFELPEEVRQIIEAWQATGGKVVVDGTTTVKFKGAIVTKGDFRDPAYRWSVPFTLAEKKGHPFKSEREASYHHTNWFMDEMARKAVAPMREAMKKTESRPAIVTDDLHLAAEWHRADNGQEMILVLNAFEKLPELPDTERYPLYNHAAHEATITLAGVTPKRRVWCIEGADWKKASAVKDPTKPLNLKFEPGEMKLFLVAPAEESGGIDHLSALRQGGSLEVMAAGREERDRAVLPFTLTIHGPDGKELYRAHRALVNGEYRERFPIGMNAPTGSYRVVLEAPLSGRKSVTANWRPHDLPHRIPQHTREAEVYDEAAIRKLLASKQPVRVVATEGLTKQGEALVKELTARGMKASLAAPDDVLKKVAYPRVWNPFAQVYRPAGEAKKPAGVVLHEVTVTVGKDGSFQAVTKDGKDVSTDWQKPESVITFAGEGYVDYSGDREVCYEAGVRMYIDTKRQKAVLNGSAKEERTTPAFRARWAKPWHRLTTHVGGYQYPPQLPEAFTAEGHLIVLGENEVSRVIAAGEILDRVADGKDPGPGRALVQYVWGPFAPDADVVLVSAVDAAGVGAGVKALMGVR
jgi:hypothetical protein